MCIRDSLKCPNFLQTGTLAFLFIVFVAPVRAIFFHRCRRFPCYACVERAKVQFDRPSGVDCFSIVCHGQTRVQQFLQVICGRGWQPYRRTLSSAKWKYRSTSIYEQLMTVYRRDNVLLWPTQFNLCVGTDMLRESRPNNDYTCEHMSEIKNTIYHLSPLADVLSPS